MVNTAPVAIGNSIRGSKSRVTNTANGVRVVGRDFGFALAATGSTVTDWSLVGGMPITPAVLPSSILRNYCQMFGHFKVNSLTAHYITSSPTSQAGDVMFYFERDRKAPLMDYTNSSFLPFVLSDPMTVIGPQWTNHSLEVEPVPEWKTTTFAINSDLNEDAAGTIFFFSKTNATNSPGYVLFDYDISFRDMSVNPRAGQLPVSRGQCNIITIGYTAQNNTTGLTLLTGLVVQGIGLGGAVGNMPTGSQPGDIFKLTLAATSSLSLNTWTTVTLANLLVDSGAVDVPITVDDGFTMYGRWADTTPGGGSVPTMSLFPTIESALSANTATGAYRAGNNAAAGTCTLICQAQLVASTSASFIQSSY
jgi:hypothetical protein